MFDVLNFGFTFQLFNLLREQIIAKLVSCLGCGFL
jgi:hypothetical protein